MIFKLMHLAIIGTIRLPHVAAQVSTGCWRADITHDGIVNVEDLLNLLSAYGQQDNGLRADIDESGQVGVDDLLLLLAAFGLESGCEPQPQEPIDCVGSYGELSDCSEPCGPTGVATRSFVITTPASNGGQECSVAAGFIETQSCNTEIACPVDCVGAMGDWSSCSVPCGGGMQTRNFTVTTPATNGGSCDADGTSESQACNTDTCPSPPNTGR